VSVASACPRCGTVDGSGRLSVCPRCLLLDLGGGGPGGAASAAGDLPRLGADGLVLEAELGRGGMGRVFRARDERLGRAVAVKVLRPESAANPDFRARFAREARLLAQLEHPGIVAVHDFGTTPDGEAYLVMQLVSGGSIADRLPLPIADALAIAVELCRALAYAHARGIVHRDIKPENVLLGDDGRARLSDFGIARLVDPTPEDAPLTRPSMVLGTPGYMAPEARAGARPDPRMDVYAVGALLRHMLTGRHPDAGGGAPAAGAADAAPVPPPLAAVIARATAIDPARRTPDAHALGDELAAFAAQFKSAPRAAFALPPEERVWRGAVALLAAVATAVALYAALVSLTPRTMAADDAIPFTAFGNQPLDNGRVLTRARFEVWPTLGAAVAIAIALGAYGLLRRHWRAAGLDRPAPDRPLAGSRRVLRMGIVLFALFVLHQLLALRGATAVVTYIPVLGGCLELLMLYRFWDAALEGQQTSRSLTREPLLWLGLALALFPPTYSMALLVGPFGR
jgi:eukaryotic-like serine/threonine-protein kinase